MSDDGTKLATVLEIARLLQEGKSTGDVLPALSRAITKVVPAREVEVTLKGSALRVPASGKRILETEPSPPPKEPAIEDGALAVPLRVAGRAFGAVTLYRDDPFTPADRDALVDLSRVISLGMWSRFVQVK